MSGSSMHAPRVLASAATRANVDPPTGGSVGKQTRVGSPFVAPPSEATAIAVVHIAHGVLANAKRGPIYQAPTNAYGPLSQLHAAVVGRGAFYPFGMTPAEQLEAFDAAVAALRPWLKVASANSQDDLIDFAHMIQKKREELELGATRDDTADAEDFVR